MCRKRGLDLRLFEGFRRGVPLNRPESTELRERHDRGGLPAEVNHLVRLGRFRAGSRLHTHIATVPDNDVANPTARPAQITLEQTTPRDPGQDYPVCVEWRGDSPVEYWSEDDPEPEPFNLAEVNRQLAALGGSED